MRDVRPIDLIDVLDRVLDKGIVIDAWVQVSVAGLELVTIEARCLVASFQTYLNHAAEIKQLAPASRAIEIARQLPAVPERASQRKLRGRAKESVRKQRSLRH